METDTPAAPTPQPKTFAQRLEEAKEQEQQLWILVKQAEDARTPFQERYETRLHEWAEVRRRIEGLELIQKELER